MTDPPQLQFRGIGAPGTPGHPALSPVALAQEAGQENVTTQPQLMENRSVRDLALRLKSANQSPVQVSFLSQLRKVIIQMSPSNNQKNICLS